MPIRRVDNTNLSTDNTIDNPKPAPAPVTTTTTKSTTTVDANRDKRLNSQFVRSRMSIGSRAVQDKLKTELSKPKQIKISKDPDLATDEKKAQAANPSLYPFKNIENGELFVDDVKATDVVQGSLGDCYLVAALSAVAHTDPDFIKQGIHDNGDGTYTVRIYNYSPTTDKYRAKNIRVDDKVPMRSDGKTPLYGTSAPTKSGKMEKWVSILEKAIAVSQGGYDAIGDDGGVSSDVMEMITGKKSQFYSTYNMSFKTLQRQINAGHPVTAATRSEKKEELYRGTNIFPWHVYTVLGTEVKDGKQYVTLRNPWGDTEPGNDGVDDGIFKLTFADFKKYYIDVYVSEA